MKNSASELILYTCLLLVWANSVLLRVNGQVTDYQTISQRNAFGLKAPSPPAIGPVPEPRRAKIIITGITTIFGDKRVLLKSLPPPGNPGEPAGLEESYILAEGQTNAQLQIIRVDAAANTVTLKNAGVVEVLKLQEPWNLKFGPPPPPAALPVPGNAFAAAH